MSIQLAQISPGKRLVSTGEGTQWPTSSFRASRSSLLAAGAHATRCLEWGLLVLFLSLTPRLVLAIERADWPQRVEADWLLAEEVAAQDQLGGLVTTKAYAARETLVPTALTT